MQLTFLSFVKTTTTTNSRFLYVIVMVESRFWKSVEHTSTTVFVSMEGHDRTTVSLSYGKALKAARGRGENAKGKL